MQKVKDVLESTTTVNLLVNGGVVLTGAIVAIVSFGFLLPLDSAQAATGVTIIMGVSYALAIVAWVVVMMYYSHPDRSQELVWLLTHMVFLVMFPATIAATAMNVTAIQNTRNLLAGKIST